MQVDGAYVAGRLLGIFVGTLLLSAIGGVMLRVGVAFLAKGKSIDIGRACRCVFYPALVATVVGQGIVWAFSGSKDMAGTAAMLGAAAQIATFLFLLASFVSGELEVSFGRAMALAGVVQGGLIVLGLVIWFALGQMGYDFR